MEDIDWNMVKAITGCLSFVLLGVGGMILAASKAIFITKKEFQSFLCEIDKKLYRDGLPIFTPCEECEKKYDNLSVKIEKISDKLVTRKEFTDLSDQIVPRKEIEKTNAFRDRRIDVIQREVVDKLSDMSETMKDLQKTQNEMNVVIGKLIGMYSSGLMKDGNL